MYFVDLSQSSASAPPDGINVSVQFMCLMLIDPWLNDIIGFCTIITVPFAIHRIYNLKVKVNTKYTLFNTTIKECNMGIC